MSMIGNFGICPKSNYNHLVNLLEKNPSPETDAFIEEIYSILQESEGNLENDKCSGEVFLALFDYLKTAHGIDVHNNIVAESFGEKWRAATEDYDIVVFNEKDPILSLENAINYNELAEYINDFYQTDYNNAGQTACSVLFRNLKSAKEDEVLIWHLY